MFIYILIMKIFNNYPLLHLNTFKVNAKTDELILLESHEDYAELLKTKDLRNTPYFVLGAGSNVLFTRDYQGICIKNQLKNISVIREDARYAWLSVDAGMNWHELVRKTIDMNIQGLENLSLIPGTVGAAPVQNIGAYGVEIHQFIEHVDTLDLQGGEFFRFYHQECEFGYRSSVFKTKYKGRFLITSVVLRLNKKPEFNLSYEMIQETLERLKLDQVNARNISEAIIYIRQNKLPDPDVIGNAGSFFKNPVVDKTDYEGLKAEFPGMRSYQVDSERYKIPAAWLIESCGWKGKSYGKAGVYQNQPLVLVNLGNASGKDILKLSEKIQEAVAKKFGILLIPEVNIL